MEAFICAILGVGSRNLTYLGLTDFETTLVQLACPDQCPEPTVLARVWQALESSCMPLSTLPSGVL